MSLLVLFRQIVGPPPAELTLRDYFAAAAASGSAELERTQEQIDALTARAYQIADSMIAERE